MSKYHVALSFAGEDREYVEAVAEHLRTHGVDVFYDKFEETNLWGKDLYAYLVDIYNNRALYTVMFVSEAYRDKLWTNHERKSAQARAFTESEDCILPAMFDENVKIPGLLKTTGYISLTGLSPEDFAEKILKKLNDEGVLLAGESNFLYSEEAKADADFPLAKRNPVTDIIEALRSYNWYTQNPAIKEIFKLDMEALTRDELFVLGRNIYQCACGGERKAVSILENLRRELAKIPKECAEHLLNGMFYEVYFNSSGEFRGRDLKSKRIDQLYAIQSVKKYGECVSYIRRVLQPFHDGLAVLPNRSPEIVDIQIRISRKDPPHIKDIKFKGMSMIVDSEDDEDSSARMWKLSFMEFSIATLKEHLVREWHIPAGQLRVQCKTPIDDSTKFRLPEGKTIQHPYV